MVPPEFPKNASSVERARGWRKADLKASHLQRHPAGYAVTRGVEFAEDLLSAGRKLEPGGRQPDASRSAIDKHDAELFLEAFDLPRERRLDDVAAFRRAREVLILRESDEVAKL